MRGRGKGGDGSRKGQIQLLSGSRENEKVSG